MEFNLARMNMLRKQIKPCCALNEKTIGIISTTPRELFVPKEYYPFAYADLEIPLPNGQKMLRPMLIAHILKALNLTGSEAVLEIGTGSGYLTTLLAKLSNHITTIELHREVAELANHNIVRQKTSNISLKFMNAFTEFKPTSLFDVIVITGSILNLPAIIYSYLAPGGKIFAIIGKNPIMQATIYTKESNNNWVEEKLLETFVPPLEEIILEQEFVW